MSKLHESNPHGRFDGLGEIYAKFRPSYPAAAIDYILERCELHSGNIIVDVGCGTGISSRLFAERGLAVIGLEPNDDMLSQARSHHMPPHFASPAYFYAPAESTGLDDDCAHAVLAAQSFHWFKPDEALQEFFRILNPGGWCVLMWNERDESDPFTAEYGKLFRSLPGTDSVELPRGQAGNALLHSRLFADTQRVNFTNEQPLNEEGLIGRAFSASYAPKEPAQIEQFSNSLRQLFKQFQKDGVVNLKYETSVYTGHRPPE